MRNPGSKNLDFKGLGLTSRERRALRAKTSSVRGKLNPANTHISDKANYGHQYPNGLTSTQFEGKALEELDEHAKEIGFTGPGNAEIGIGVYTNEYGNIANYGFVEAKGPEQIEGINEKLLKKLISAPKDITDKEGSQGLSIGGDEFENNKIYGNIKAFNKPPKEVNEPTCNL